MSREDNGLRLRLVNCLQTIIDLEPDLEQLDLVEKLDKEIKVLKTVINRIDQFRVEEEDVLRVEEATSVFLQELRLPLACKEQNKTFPRLLQ